MVCVAAPWCCAATIQLPIANRLLPAGSGPLMPGPAGPRPIGRQLMPSKALEKKSLVYALSDVWLETADVACSCKQLVVLLCQMAYGLLSLAVMQTCLRSSPQKNVLRRASAAGVRSALLCHAMQVTRFCQLLQLRL